MLVPSPRSRLRLPLTGIFIAAIVGIVIADGWLPPLPALAVIAAVLAAWSILTASTPACLACAAVSFAALHTSQYRLDPTNGIQRELARYGPRVAEIEGIVCTEPEPLAYASRKQSGTFQVRTQRMEIGGEPLLIDCTLMIKWAGALPAYGDVVRTRGSLRPIEPPRNPGQFDYANYLHRKRIYGRLESERPQDCEVLGHGAGNPLIAWSFTARNWMQRQLALDLEGEPDLTTLITSMVLGMRGDAPEEMQDAFRRTGTMHLFAVSGLNVAMLGIIAWYILKPFGIRRKTAVFLIIPLLAFYTLVTGLSASCVRAALMASIVLLGELIEQRSFVLNSLAAAGIGILICDTSQFFATGFQLSFLLVFVIVLLTPAIQRKLEPLGQPDAYLPRMLWNRRQRLVASLTRVAASSIGVTISAWLGSIFLTAGYFHLFSPSGLIANVFAVPLAFVVLALGLLTLLFAPFAKAIAVLFSNANWGCAKVLLWVVESFVRLPAGHQYVEWPSVKPPPTAEFTVLDVGEGAAIHLRSGGNDWLIDAGSAWRYPTTTLPYLRSRGIDALDVLVLTHGDAQHIGAALAVVDDLSPHVILDTPLKDRSSSRRKLHAGLAERKRGKAFAERGECWDLGGATVTVLFPLAGIHRSLADDKALVLRLECNGIRVLFMSDSGFATENWLLEYEPDLVADIIVKGHHSKDFSGTPEFIARVNPQAIIVGEPKYGSAPDALDAWANELAAQGIAVFQQSRGGAVSGSIRSNAFELKGYLDHQTFRSRAR